MIVDQFVEYPVFAQGIFRIRWPSSAGTHFRPSVSVRSS